MPKRRTVTIVDNIGQRLVVEVLDKVLGSVYFKDQDGEVHKVSSKDWKELLARAKRRDNPGVRELSSYSTYAALDQFLGNRDERKIANNTTAVRLEGLGPEEGRAIAIILHHTKIVTFYEYGGLTLNSGGYRTATTKQRMRQFLPLGWSMNRDWSLSGRDPDNQPLDLTFYDGIGIPTREGFPPKAQNPRGRKLSVGERYADWEAQRDRELARERITASDVNATRNANGYWVLSTIKDGHRVQNVYGGYSKRDAMQEFLAAVNGSRQRLDNPAGQLWYPGGVAIGRYKMGEAGVRYYVIPVESTHGWDFPTLVHMFPDNLRPDGLALLEARLGYEHSGQQGYHLFKVRVNGKWSRPLRLRTSLTEIPGVK